jgi:glucosylceramidase
VINWNVALDRSGGPHVGGCGNCTGILTIGPGDKVTPDAEYYTLGQLSRFVEPGAFRIASTSFGTTGWNGEVMDVAFRDPDGTTVLVAHNENDNPRRSACWRATAASPPCSPATRWPRSRGPVIRAAISV